VAVSQSPLRAGTGTTTRVALVMHSSRSSPMAPATCSSARIQASPSASTRSRYLRRRRPRRSSCGRSVRPSLLQPPPPAGPEAFPRGILQPGFAPLRDLGVQHGQHFSVRTTIFYDRGCGTLCCSFGSQPRGFGQLNVPAGPSHQDLTVPPCTTGITTMPVSPTKESSVGKPPVSVPCT
jgi:hypothetical protein